MLYVMQNNQKLRHFRYTNLLRTTVPNVSFITRVDFTCYFRSTRLAICQKEDITRGRLRFEDLICFAAVINYWIAKSRPKMPWKLYRIFFEISVLLDDDYNYSVVTSLGHTSKWGPQITGNREQKTILATWFSDKGQWRRRNRLLTSERKAITVIFFFQKVFPQSY